MWWSAPALISIFSFRVSGDEAIRARIILPVEGRHALESVRVLVSNFAIKDDRKDRLAGRAVPRVSVPELRPTHAGAFSPSFAFTWLQHQAVKFGGNSSGVPLLNTSNELSDDERAGCNYGIGFTSVGHDKHDSRWLVLGRGLQTHFPNKNFRPMSSVELLPRQFKLAIAGLPHEMCRPREDGGKDGDCSPRQRRNQRLVVFDKLSDLDPDKKRQAVTGAIFLAGVSGLLCLVTYFLRRNAMGSQKER